MAIERAPQVEISQLGGSIVETVDLFRKLVENITEANPEDSSQMGIYDLSKAIVSKLPQKTPFVVQRKALQSFASTDTNTRRLGQEAFLFLNLKTLVIVVDSYFVEGIDTKDDRNDMMASALVSVQERLININPTFPIPSQVHRAAKAGVIEYIKTKDDMPTGWISDADSRSMIATAIKESIAGRDISGFGKEEFRKLAEGLSLKTGISENGLLRYLKRLQAVSDIESSANDQSQGGNIVQGSIDNEKLKQELDTVLQKLPDRERKIIELKFGLEDGKERTNGELGRTFHVIDERIRQIQAKAFRRLRPALRFLTEDYFDPENLMFGYIRYSENLRFASKRIAQDVLSIDSFNINDSDKKRLNEIGIKQVGDLLTAPIGEIKEAWGGIDRNRIRRVYRLLGERIERLNLRMRTFELIPHIIGSFLYRNQDINRRNDLSLEEKQALFDLEFKIVDDLKGLRVVFDESTSDKKDLARSVESSILRRISQEIKRDLDLL